MRAQAAAARAQRDREAAALWEQAVRGQDEPIGQSREALYNPNFAEFEALCQAQLQEWLRHARHAPNLDQQADRIQAHMRVLAGSKLLMPRWMLRSSSLSFSMGAGGAPAGGRACGLCGAWGGSPSTPAQAAA